MSYDASHIEVLEGLEGVRKRPGMYIGGTDQRALHHLLAEILDNAMDEAVAGHADKIWLVLAEDGSVLVRDNGRGIPVEPHPSYPDKSALEVVMTMLHAGGKFNNNVYATAGGLHGVGLSVVAALSEWAEVTVERNGKRFRQRYELGKVVSPVLEEGKTRRCGTQVAFLPDKTIFTDPKFQEKRVVEMCRSRAYLNRGVKIQLKVAASDTDYEFHFPNGLSDFLRDAGADKGVITTEPFEGRVESFGDQGKCRMEWALTWSQADDNKVLTYCNTVPTPAGGSHESGLLNALVRGLREFGKARNLLPKNMTITRDDALGGVMAIFSLFIPDPQFSGQTKEKLNNPAISRVIEAEMKDRLEQWMHGHAEQAVTLVEHVVSRAKDRMNRRKASAVKRKSPTSRLTLPGKLTDCVSENSLISELFIVEGDSAGGSAKQARDRHTQAILPLRGKILNVEQAKQEKFEKNVEVQSLITAIGAGCGRSFNLKSIRYGRVIIMTDADVDGAHIASLLLTFFYRFMKPLVMSGHLYMAMPPLYKVASGRDSQYALDERERDVAIKRFKKKRPNAKITISRFKGLGEMDPIQLRETTMSPKVRRLLQVTVDDDELTDDTFDRLMGKRPAERFRFIQDRADFAGENLDI
ncbi:MAG: type IIA DNA topoisomerase subunit B [Magnetococcales bacterium]|nr:type IIA DNA topoisomerase subunit B [Magnetococcales bacterium]